MKRFMFVATFSLVFCALVSAEDVPKAEVFGGFSYLRVSIPYLENDFNFNGWNASLAVNANSWFAVVADINGHYNTSPEFGFNFNTKAHSFLFGPQFSIRRNNKVTPFINALFGFSHLSQTVTPVLIFGPTSGSWNDFAMGIGGGLNINVNQTIAIRLFQADYFLLRDNGGDSQSTTNNLGSFRFSTGLVFKLGKHKH